MYKLHIYEHDYKNGKRKTFRSFLFTSKSEAIEVYNLFAVAFNSVGVTISAYIYKLCGNGDFAFECSL